MKKLLKIFIVEDDLFYANLLQKELLNDHLGYIHVFNDGETFMENLFQMPDIVLLDYNLGNMLGINILKKIKSINPNIQVIILSAQEKLEIAVTSLRYGAYDYVEKNDHSFIRVKSIIGRILLLNEEIEKQKRRIKIRRLVLIMSAIITLVASYLAIKYSTLF